MDNYPEHLAPEFDADGGVVTPFPEWWSRVQSHFPGVPENVARQWLHRHWDNSPFSFLSSSRYLFEKESWPSSQLTLVLSGANSWDLERTRVQGEYLYGRNSWVVRYMRRNRRFPEPIIVLDNRNSVLTSDPDAPNHAGFPDSFIVVEGHKRFELAIWMLELGELEPHVEVWLMKAAKKPFGGGE